ncbi:hypothetical protein L6R50_09975 [Myxococcota bacterium]|nr:hypothetical protein [Myxococcota bacterium]
MSDPRKTPLPALIVYTSRTGRTERAVKALKTHLEWRNFETDTLKLGGGKGPGDLSRYRLIVFGGPDGGLPLVAPRPDSRLRAFIESLPSLDGRKVAAFALSPVETKRTSAAALRDLLIAKGADVVITESWSALQPDRDVADLAAECMIRVYR